MFGVIDGTLTSEVIGSSKIPTHGVTLELDDSLLQIVADSEHIQDYRTINLSKFKVELDGLDQEGYLRLRIVPRLPKRLRKAAGELTNPNNDLYVNARLEEALQEPEQDSIASKRHTRRVARVPKGFSLYSEKQTDQGNWHRIYRNQANSFILMMETKSETRKYTLGSSYDPTSYLGKLMAIIAKAGKPLSFKEIHILARNNHMSDTNKLHAALDVQTREIELVYEDGKYVVPLDDAPEKRAGNMQLIQ